MSSHPSIHWALLFGLMLKALTPVTLQAIEAAQSSPTSQHGEYFYVSTAGRDAWSGTLPAANSDRSDGPFQTLRRARDAIRELKSQGTLEGPVTVMLLHGTYFLSEPFVLDGQDSGTEDRPITYTVYPGHKAVLSGGRRIVGWKPYRGQILQARLPEAAGGRWKFRQLFFDDRRQIRSRWPNRDPRDPLYGGWAFIEATLPAGEKQPVEFRFAPGQAPRQWAKPQQVEINVFPWYCWVNDIIPIERADSEKRTVTLTRPVHFDFMPLMSGNRFYVENALEELDRPGEWCLDAETGTLYFWPPGGTVQPGEVTAPVADELIELRGRPDKPVRHVTISGLTFTETLSPFPDHQHESHHSPSPDGAAVHLEHSTDCRVLENRFYNLGGDAVRLQNANARNQIIGNQITQVGGAGISLASRQPGNTHTWADKALLHRNAKRYPKLVRNVISNNHIHHCGMMKKNCGGVQLYGINSVENVISHNLIHHMSDKGMTMQDGFGQFIVEYNEMHTLGLEIADTGGIMTNRWFVLHNDADLGGGNIIRFNFIRDCIGCGAYSEKRSPKGEGDRLRAGGRIWSPYYTWGIYFDNSGMDINVYGNVVVSTVLGGVSMPVGSPQNNRVENNIFIGSSGNQLDLRMGPGARGNRFVRNIVYYSNPDAALLAARPSAKQTIAQCDDNLYFLKTGQNMRVRGIEGGTFGDWRNLGFDKHSLIADPLFVDAAGGDYRLRPESPAFKLGFRPIDLDRIGLQGKYRTLAHEKSVGRASNRSDGNRP
ncbi:MAG: right-handed parallel beta-helix repeat-containing protein [Pirellulaceae bacterium]|jgi:hypothetical protein|nr:right-handed parallel beta-helix repeat-containing protein [Pirellulaceae bacterium]HJN13679.1 right-handed parallel beta-helix repeat-containing protein [Pirellulaceae bacterium]